jgi:hypothetical protein
VEVVDGCKNLVEGYLDKKGDLLRGVGRYTRKQIRIDRMMKNSFYFDISDFMISFDWYYIIEIRKRLINMLILALLAKSIYK